MKLKNILGAIVCVATLAVSATSVFAKGETFIINDPIDLATGEKAEHLTAGMAVAFPIDMITDELTAAMGFRPSHNTEYLEAGLVDADLTDAQYDNACDLGELIPNGAEEYSGIDMMIFALGEVNRKGNFVSYGYPGASYKMVNWYDAYDRQVYADKPEFYMLYKVVKDVPDDALNFKLIDLVIADCMISVNMESVLEKNPDPWYANTCYGAFKLNIDSSSLDQWVQGLQVSIDDGTKKAVTEYVTTDNVNYSFPVRVTSNSKKATTATVNVYADVSNSETDTVNTTNVMLGSFTLNLDSPTAYATPVLE